MSHTVMPQTVLDLRTLKPVTSATGTVLTRADEVQPIDIYADPQLTVPLDTVSTDAQGKLQRFYVADTVWGGKVRFASANGPIDNPFEVDELPDGLALVSQFSEQNSQLAQQAQAAQDAAADAAAQARQAAQSASGSVTLMSSLTDADLQGI